MKETAHTAVNDAAYPGKKELQQTEYELINMYSMINNITGIMWSIDRNYNLVTSNIAFNMMVEGMSGKKIEKGQSVFIEGFNEADLANFREYYDRAFAGETFTIEQYNDIYDRWCDISFHPIRHGYSIIGTACCSCDITDRKRADIHLRQAKRLYAFTSQINQAIIYAKNEQALFDEVCRIAIKTGGFDVACTGAIDMANSSLSIVAQSNLSANGLDSFSPIRFSADGPIAAMLLNNKRHIINDYASEPEHSAWKLFDTSRNMKSAVTLPIKRSGEIKFALFLSSAKANIFNSEEIDLLEQVAANISFALDTFEQEKQRIIAENKLKHQEIRNRQAQHIARLGSWEYDFSTGLCRWSEEHCRIYGISENNNIHSIQSWLSFIHPDDLAYVREKAEKMLADPQYYSFYYRIIRKDNAVRHIYFENKIDYNAEGKPQSMYGIAHDVTAKKAAEEKLRHIAARLNRAQAITHLGSWELDFSTGFGIWSDECCRIYGLDTNDNIHTFEDWMSFIHPEDLDYVMEEASKANATHSNSSMIHRIIRKDGATRYIQSQAHFEFNSKGIPIGLYGTAHDITEHMTNMTRLKAQNEQLREIAWIQSHKVRGPLATILGLAELFNTGYAINTDEIIQGILTTSQKLDTVIHEIVDKTQASEIPEERSPYAA